MEILEPPIYNSQDQIHMNIFGTMWFYPQPFCVAIKGRGGYNVVGILEEAAHDSKNFIPYAVIILCETKD